MTQRLFVTIGSRVRKDRVLLEMPGDQPIRSWIRDLVQVVGWKELAVFPPDGFCLETEEGEPLPEGETLQGAGITSSDVLFLAVREMQVPLAAEGEAVYAASEQKGPETPAADEAALAYVRGILRNPHLAGPQGLIIPVDKLPLVIGRTGKGSAPDIDLSEWDTKVITSRTHAVLEKDGEGFSLRPEKTTNGTFINGVEVPAGESRILRDGDRIQFGFKGLELVFQLPKN